ncbi:MAG TPA: hypothetical protein ENI99_00480 [Sedimenticola sp.]|nr:hypothetical protein [Sedimenticola sp.]
MLGFNDMTPLFVTIQKNIKDDFHLLDINQIEPWVFFNSGKPMRVKKHDGKQISYEGGGFEGSPQDVFWGKYIEPFIEEIAVKQVNSAVELSKSKNINGVNVLKEAEMLLYGEISKVFSKMAKIEQRLLGKGYPEKVKARDVQPYISASSEFVKALVQSEISMWSTKPWYELWYEKNKFIIWAAGVFLTMVGLYAKFK